MKRKLEISELIFKIISYTLLTVFALCCLYPFLYAVSASISGRHAVEYQELAYYIVGTFLGENNEVVNFAVKADVTPKFTVENGVATVTFTVADVTTNEAYKWIKDQGKTDANGNAACFSMKVVFGSEIEIKDWYGNGSDNFYLAAGTYTVTFDIATGTVTVVAA